MQMRYNIIDCYHSDELSRVR